MTPESRRPRIGISANFLHADPHRALYRGKTLQYLEGRMLAAVWNAGGLPIMIPLVPDAGAVRAFIDEIDGLILSGGADVSPESYGEVALQEAWAGDRVRDVYEMNLVEMATQARRPLLGLCRGIQLLNVALGGTLWQDVPTLVTGALEHRDWHRYDELAHPIGVRAGSWLSELYDGATTLHVNSVHHQALRLVASGLTVVAQAEDGIIEAVEWIDDSRWQVGLQWHPEWLEPERLEADPIARDWTDGARVFRAFVGVVASWTTRRSPSSA